MQIAHKKEKIDHYDNNDKEDNNKKNQTENKYKTNILLLDTNSKLTEGKIRNLAKTNFFRDKIKIISMI